MATKTFKEQVILMAKKSYSPWLTKSLITYLSGFGFGKRKWRLGRKLNAWDQVKSPGSGPRPQRKKILEKKNCPGSVKNGMKIRKRAAMTKIVYA